MLNDASNSKPVIKCESVYKIFGNNAKKILENSNGKVSASDFQKAGCIVGVNNATFEIHKGEIKGKKTQTFSSTRLGHHVLNMYPPSNEE